MLLQSILPPKYNPTFSSDTDRGEDFAKAIKLD